MLWFVYWLFDHLSMFILQNDIFSRTSESEVPLREKSAPPMSVINVSNEGVIKMVKGLNPSKALGYDGLS